MRRSSRDKHSFIQFYFDHWNAGTAGMSRTMWSVYFQVCAYSWDKLTPVPKGRLSLMVADLPDGKEIVDALVEAGALIRDSNGAVHSPRALVEGQKSYAAWEAKSRGGKAGRSGAKSGDRQESSNNDEGQSEDCSTDRDRDRDRDREESEDSPPSRPPVDFTAVPEAWNDMAQKCGLPLIAKMTDERIKRLKARIEEHGVEELIRGIKLIPTYPFLTGTNDRGWKANFDWLLSPRYCVKLLEGGYAEGKGRPSGWTS